MAGNRPPNGANVAVYMQHIAADLQQIGRLSWAFAVNGRHGLSLGDCGEW